MEPEDLVNRWKYPIDPWNLHLVESGYSVEKRPGRGATYGTAPFLFLVLGAIVLEIAHAR